MAGIDFAYDDSPGPDGRGSSAPAVADGMVTRFGPDRATDGVSRRLPRRCPALCRRATILGRTIETGVAWRHVRFGVATGLANVTGWPTFESLRGRAHAGDLEGAQQELAVALNARVDERGGHLEGGRIAAELGLVGLARRELHLALRDAPDDRAVLTELAELHADAGDAEQEVACRERLRSLGDDGDDNLSRLAALFRLLGLEKRARELTGDAGSDEPEPEPPLVADAPDEEATDPLLEATDADLVRFLHLFAGREDVHARQWFEPGRGCGYSPVRQPLTADLLRAHTAGSVTLGVYPLRLDGTVTFFALDLDIVRPAIDRARGDADRTRTLRRLVREEGLRLHHEAGRLGLSLLLEDSGYKGRHVWGFLAEPLPGDLVRRFVTALVRALRPASRDLSVEGFPKQRAVKRNGLGNLIKLPLGIHRRSSRRALFLDDTGRPVADPWPLLRGVERIDRTRLLDVLGALRDAPAPPPAEPTDEDGVEEVCPWPAPLPPPAPFTEADFELQPEVAALLRRCPVLEALVCRGLERRRLAHDERVVLRHTLGHVPGAVPAVNYLFERCPEVPTDAFLKSPLRGSPISCPRVRKRVPEVTALVPCHCEFPTRPDHYPTPLLHLDEARARGELAPARPEAEEPRAPLPEDLARTFSHLAERQQRLEGELQEVRGAFVDALSSLPERALETAEGRWVLRDEDGLPVVEWCPAEGD